MYDWKVGDRVEITQYSSTMGVDTIVEITKGGNIRLSKNNNLYTESGKLRGAGKWSSTYIHKISEEEYQNYFVRQKLKVKRKKIIDKLNAIQEKDLLVYQQKIDMVYESLLGE